MRYFTGAVESILYVKRKSVKTTSILVNF